MLLFTQKQHHSYRTYIVRSFSLFSTANSIACGCVYWQYRIWSCSHVATNPILYTLITKSEKWKEKRVRAAWGEIKVLWEQTWLDIHPLRTKGCLIALQHLVEAGHAEATSRHPTVRATEKHTIQFCYTTQSFLNFPFQWGWCVHVFAQFRPVLFMGL